MKRLGEYPLEGKWQRLRREIETSPKPDPTGIDRTFYLDLAERIVRAAAPWQDESGTIIDPYYGKEFRTSTSRFVGALGQLIKAGRCLNMVDVCLKSYEACLLRLDEVESAPEFWTSPLMYAHEALKDRVRRRRLRRWERTWRNHKPRQCYICIVDGATNNFLVFALAGEFFKHKQGLGGDLELIEEAIDHLSEDFTEFGMYRDPNDPMTYDLVVKQKLDMICSYGYSGRNLKRITDICRRGALTSLLYQSTIGQMPFGGRSNQFHFVEAFFACLCESQARAYKEQGDLLTAGIFKRAARRAVKTTAPWIMDMEPFRHTKQGFDPKLMYGVDSWEGELYGHYSVYGLLAASLLGTAYHLADETIDEVITPAEVGGYAFDLWPAFHKVFATCGGYHVEIDTRADHYEDATGLGRVHRDGIWPETALSGSISPSVHYTVDQMFMPQKSLAIGPAWLDDNGDERHLADFEDEIKDVSLNVIEEMTNKVAFEVVYQGDFGQCRKITEKYGLSQDGLSYEVISDNSSLAFFVLVPLIKTDGIEESQIEVTDEGFSVKYRNCLYRVSAGGPADATLSEDKPAANRNAVYLTGVFQTNRINIALEAM